MVKLLIVDDEKNIREVVREYASLNGYESDEAENGLEAVELVKANRYDCVILDIMMPILDGFSACKQIRQIQDVPVIMLSARQEEYDKLFGFEVGVDDYVTKPFSPKELMARINVIIKRHAKPQEKTEKESVALKFGGLEIDTLGHTLFVDGEKVDLTAKEYDVLLYLANNKGIVLTRDQILSAVWGYDYFGEDRTVDWQIKLLRNKLGRYREMIHTVRGVGYKFDE